MGMNRDRKAVALALLALSCAACGDDAAAPPKPPPRVQRAAPPAMIDGHDVTFYDAARANA